MRRRRVITLNDLRQYAVARSLFAPTSLPKAIARLGFVQADPIRAPARAQDLTLRHRVRDYRAGDLERRYPKLAIEEDFFVNYGYLPRAHHALMHPREPRAGWSAARKRQAQEVLAFVRERGTAHPREVDAHFEHGRVRNWFGGTSNASTQLLDEMHYRGLLRVARRDSGTRVYAVREVAADESADCNVEERLDQLLDIIIAKYAPLPAASLGQLLTHLKGGIPQWAEHRKDALERAKARLASVTLDGTAWYWPANESPSAPRWQADAGLRLLAPFDPVVWDRRRFELFWGWAYRFEAYTPAPKRKLGYYALPMLWRNQVIGWANLAVSDQHLQARLGYVAGKPPAGAAYADALEQELSAVAVFLGLSQHS